MNIRKLDFETWARKEIYLFYSGPIDPFYSVSFQMDVTEAYRYAEKNKVSFYYTMIYLCMMAMDPIENFHYLINNETLYYVDHRHASFTAPWKEDLFKIITVPWLESFSEFLKISSFYEESQQKFIRMEEEGDDLVCFSCLPWIDMTSMSNPRDRSETGKNSSMPDICWGKFRNERGRMILVISMEVNHRFIDGRQIGMFAENLRKEIGSLNEMQL